MTLEEFDKLDRRFSELYWHQAKIDVQVTDLMDELVDLLITNNRFEFDIEEDLYWPQVWDNNESHLTDVEGVKIDPDGTIYIKACDGAYFEIANTNLTDLEVCEMLLSEVARIE